MMVPSSFVVELAILVLFHQLHTTVDILICNKLDARTTYTTDLEYNCADYLEWSGWRGEIIQANSQNN